MRRPIKLGVACLWLATMLGGCSNTDGCDSAEMEGSQMRFLNEFMAANGLTSKDFIASTASSNGCSTSNIIDFKVSDKQLKSVPSSISNMRFLESLYFVNCGLDSLPSTLTTMTQIRSILLEGNHLCSVTPAMDSFLSARSTIWKKQQTCP